MIANAQVLGDVRQSWAGMRELRQKVAIAVPHGVIAFSGLIFIANVPYNLPFLHACGVLNDALEQLAKEQSFTYKERNLGPLIDASVGILPWNDLPLIKEAKDQRDGPAHRGVIVQRDDCLRYIDAIEVELVQWGIVQL
jgi:hypothetical protein